MWDSLEEAEDESVGVADNAYADDAVIGYCCISYSYCVLDNEFTLEYSVNYIKHPITISTE